MQVALVFLILLISPHLMAVPNCGFSDAPDDKDPNHSSGSTGPAMPSGSTGATASPTSPSPSAMPSFDYDTVRRSLFVIFGGKRTSTFKTPPAFMENGLSAFMSVHPGLTLDAVEKMLQTESELIGLGVHLLAVDLDTNKGEDPSNLQLPVPTGETLTYKLVIDSNNITPPADNLQRLKNTGFLSNLRRSTSP